MTGAASFRALLARVETADGPDRELDSLIADSLGEEAECPESHLGYPGGRAAYLRIAAPHYTASLDAVVALVENGLPPIKAFAPGSPPSSGWKVNLYRGMTPTGEPHASWECCIRPHAGAETWHRAPTAALAVLCAFLSAFLAQAEAAVTPPRTATAPEAGR